MVHWRREWQTTSVFLPWESHEQHAKAKTIRHWKMNSSDCRWQHATGEEQKRTTNSPRKNEVCGPKQKQLPVVDTSGDESKIWSYKEQYSIGTWNVRSMNQSKLNVVKQKMVRINSSLFCLKLHTSQMKFYLSQETLSQSTSHKTWPSLHFYRI